MATIAAAFGSSHSIMLTTELGDWLTRFRDRDHLLPLYDDRGDPSPYAEVLARAPADAEERITPALITRRFHETQAAMDRLKQEIAAARLDALVIIGDDQYELFFDENMPSIGIYYGGTIRNAARPPVPHEDWYKRGQERRREPGDAVDYPCNAALALHLIQGLVEQDFDIAAMKALPTGEAEGHAYSFVHHRYLSDKPVPIVPIYLNTYNPPNQPRPRRCAALGRQIARLIESFPENLRVGVMASGGLSHFRVDEVLDNGVFDAIRRKDIAWLERLDPRHLQAGSSEIRAWIAVAAAATSLEMTWSAYVPAYRTPALTGTGLGFARWS